MYEPQVIVAWRNYLLVQLKRAMQDNNTVSIKHWCDELRVNKELMQ